MKVDKRSDWNCRLNWLFHKATLLFSWCGDAFKREGERERERAWARQVASIRFPIRQLAIHSAKLIFKYKFLLVSIEYLWKESNVCLNNIVIRFSFRLDRHRRSNNPRVNKCQSIWSELGSWNDLYNQSNRYFNFLCVRVMRVHCSHRCDLSAIQKSDDKNNNNNNKNIWKHCLRIRKTVRIVCLEFSFHFQIV